MVLMKTAQVVVLGASPKEDRYSNQAVKALLANGYQVIPIHPMCETIHGITCAHSLAEIQGPVDTLTVYLNPERSSQIVDSILKVNPRRLILNPGTENPELVRQAEAQGILVQEACTLVLLSTGQFDK